MDSLKLIRISQTIHSNYCCQEILDILRKLADQNLLLFSLTTDIDNLGLFLAANGRAIAQNRVDLVTNIIIKILHELSSNNKNIIEVFCLPAGEELFILGLSDSKENAIQFCEIFMKKAKSTVHNYLDLDNLSISIGFCTIEAHFLNDKVNSLFRVGMGDLLFRDKYYEILKIIREKSAFDLDNDKFADLPVKVSPIFLRNFIYYNMREYKLRTAKELKKISKILLNDDCAVLSKEYGLNLSKISLLKKLRTIWGLQ